MSSGDITNELHALIFNRATISSNGVTSFIADFGQFENGNLFMWGGPVTDGTHTLSFAESDDDNFVNSTPIPDDQIIIPEVVKQEGFDPLVLTSPTFFQVNGITRQVGVRGIAKRFVFAVITSTGVTVGAVINITWLAKTENSPVTRNQIP